MRRIQSFTTKSFKDWIPFYARYCFFLWINWNYLNGWSRSYQFIRKSTAPYYLVLGITLSVKDWRRTLSRRSYPVNSPFISSTACPYSVPKYLVPTPYRIDTSYQAPSVAVGIPYLSACVPHSRCNLHTSSGKWIPPKWNVAGCRSCPN